MGDELLALTNPFFSIDYWDAVIRVTAPIALAALGLVLASRAGILMVGVEGVMLMSGFFSIAAVVWIDSIWLAVLVGAGVGTASALVLGVLTITLRMGDIVGGLVMHIGAIGLTGFLLIQWFPTGLTTGGRLLHAPWPQFGGEGVQVLLHQQPFVYFMLVLAFILELFLVTKWGLKVRASGESMRSALSFGIDLIGLRFAVLAAAGAILGIAGSVVGVGIVGTFDTTIVGGRGFIALAVVMLGGWRPLGALAASLVFGVAFALQFRVGLESLGGWMQLLPYLIVLLAIASLWGRKHGPAEEARDLPEEARQARNTPIWRRALALVTRSDAEADTRSRGARPTQDSAVIDSPAADTGAPPSGPRR